MGLLTTAAQPQPFVPPLENGDRLRRDEFEQRYNAMSEHVWAELVEGVVFLASPIRINVHGQPHAYLVTCAGLYRFATPGIRWNVDRIGSL